ncbi:hypothetical protein DID88_007363 [Monilinia fructigena]|uniref:Uncharacterized protein n=1 Tax=Monilinia fructigena TaxID=38457 RepID=A0A395J954_9HELO|nr:hypothetical protein DID88_007363 [Monilinia fructigena]
MIGGAGDEEEKEEKAGKADDGLLDGRKDNGKAGSGERSKAGTGEKKKGKVAAKKGKKIKLSFGDDEEELDSTFPFPFHISFLLPSIHLSVHSIYQSSVPSTTMI